MDTLYFIHMCFAQSHQIFRLLLIYASLNSSNYLASFLRPYLCLHLIVFFIFANLFLICLEALDLGLTDFSCFDYLLQTMTFLLNININFKQK